MGSVTSMWRGRSSVTVSKNLILAPAFGNGDGGGGIPSFLFRRWMMVFLYVSWVNKRKSCAKIEKKIMDHWVQRQFFRTVTKEPMMGLEMSIWITWFEGRDSP
jgi:hypothetical protein